MASSNVILDSDLIPHGISRKFVKFPGETQDHFHSRVTHLHHQSQKISQIGDLSMVKHLTVLYLYDNKLTNIEHLEAIPHLRMLYLQRNKISKIENISHLTKLKKLYLSNNRISVIENLENLSNLEGKKNHSRSLSFSNDLFLKPDMPKLQKHSFPNYFYTLFFTELHVDHQELEPNQNVVFDPRSCSHLKKLRTLNTANNQMVDLQPLDLITSLYQLNISHNLLQDLQAVIDILTRIPGLKVGTQTMNPSL